MGYQQEECQAPALPLPIPRRRKALSPIMYAPFPQTGRPGPQKGGLPSPRRLARRVCPVLCNPVREGYITAYV